MAPDDEADMEGLEGEYVELTEESLPDVEDTEDGGAIVRLDEEGPAPGESEFYDNLAETLDLSELNTLGTTLAELVERDIEARKKRDELYEEGLKRTGLGNDAPGGATFEGASKVVHPMLTEVCVDFAARSIKELWPADGPTKSKIVGDVTKDKVAKAKRKSEFMNWQLTVQAQEVRAELEQLLTQLPLGGAQYLKVRWDERRNRPVFEFIPIDDIILPFAATNFYTAQRKTHRQYLTELSYKERVRNGMYVDVDLPSPSITPDETRAQQANDKIEGREADPYNSDGLRTIYEIAVIMEIEGDPKADGPAPYLVTVDHTSGRVLAVYRNWAEDDAAQDEMTWIVEFPFIPWRGAYPIGITHMIGGLSGAATGALRALLDSAHIANSQAMIKLKGGTRGGQSLTIEPTQILEIEGGLAVDDIRKLAMPLPFNPPSDVLYKLLGFLVNEAKNVVRVTLDDLAQNNANAPVGTTLALIEQGMAVYSAIHGRLHDAMGRVLRVLHRLNGMYLDDAEVEAEAGELLAKREDFEGPMDVVPVSDPNIFSEAQRFAQIQAVAQRAQLAPDLYNRRKVEERIIETLKIPNGEELLAPEMSPVEENAVAENVKASLGKPIVAFPDQDHIAHLKTHVAFMTSPVFGQNPLIAPALLPTMLQHIKEHMVLYYAAEVMKTADDAIDGEDLSELLAETKDKHEKAALDRAVAEASLDVIQASGEVFQQLAPVLAQAQQMVQQLTPPPPVDPTTQVAMADIQMRGQQGSEKAQLEREKLQVKAQDDARDDATRRAEIEAQTQRNREDNQTALILAQVNSDAAARDPNPNPQP